MSKLYIIAGCNGAGKTTASYTVLPLSLIHISNTVVRTYDYLQGQEIIYNKRGIGYFVSAGAKDRIITCLLYTSRCV